MTHALIEITLETPSLTMAQPVVICTGSQSLCEQRLNELGEYSLEETTLGEILTQRFVIQL